MATMVTTETKTAPHPGLVVAAASFSGLIVALQQTLLVPATPTFPGVLGTSASNVSWVVTATLLTGAAATPIFSRLADMYGKRRMLLVSMGLVLLGSIIAPLGGLATLIIGRALQGMGTPLVPIAMAVMRTSLDRERATSAVALLSAMLAIGGGVGIPLGGFLMGVFSWQALFVVSAVLAIVSLYLISRYIPHDEHEGAQFDAVGATVLTVALVGLLLGVSKGAEWGWGSTATLASFAFGILGLIAWVKIEFGQSSPLVDLRTALYPPVLRTHLASLLLGIVMFTNLLVTTVQLQGSFSEGGFGQSAQVAGMAMLPTAALMGFVAPISARIARRWSAATLLILGAAITLASYVLRASVTPTAWMVIVWATIASIGIGMGYAALPMLIFAHVDLSETAEANGFNALLRAIGTAVASAFVGGIGVALSATVDGVSEPSQTANLVVFIFGAVVSLIVIILGMGLRRSNGQR